jgi:hypothetical protein
MIYISAKRKKAHIRSFKKISKKSKNCLTRKTVFDIIKTRGQKFTKNDL